MSFKNINKYIIYLLFFLLLSCKQIDNFSNKNKSIIFKDSTNLKLDKELTDKINTQFTYKKSNFTDFYNQLHNVSEEEYSFELFSSFKNINNKKKDFSAFNSLIYKKELFIVDEKSNINIYSLPDFELLNLIKVDTKYNHDDYYLVSIAILEDNIFLSYSNGLIIKLDKSGNIMWEKKYIGIMKTPIKIFNEELILIYSDNIVSINIFDGEINWQYEKLVNIALRSNGGEIIELNHLIFYILPNNFVGVIDTIFGEKNDSYVNNLNLEISIDNSHDKIHSYKNIFSYFDQNRYLTTIDIQKNNFLINKLDLSQVKFANYFNNALLYLDNNNILKVINLYNGKLFDQINLSEYFKKDLKIINIIFKKNILNVFLNNGLVLLINLNNQKIIETYDLKINDINNINFFYEYIIITKNNGKISIYK